MINIDRINAKSQMLIETRAEQLINIGCAIVLKIGRWRQKKNGRKEKKEKKKEIRAQNQG